MQQVNVSQMQNERNIQSFLSLTKHALLLYFRKRVTRRTMYNLFYLTQKSFIVSSTQLILDLDVIPWRIFYLKSRKMRCLCML